MNTPIIKIIFTLVILNTVFSDLIIPEDNRFVLLTSLYNETNLDRISEYIICLEANLRNKMIKKIHVMYDNSKDDDECILFNYLMKRKVIIKPINKRPTYEDCFNLSNLLYPNSKIIISNADIYFDETLNLLSNYNLTNIFIGLTRWNININETPTLYHKLSQDSWIFCTPIKKFKSDFELGVLGCDNALIDHVKSNNFITINPCLSIKTYHLQLSGIRNYSKEHTIKCRPGYNPLDHSYLYKRSLEQDINTLNKGIELYNKYKAYSLEWQAYNYAIKNDLKEMADLILTLIKPIT
ncbi:MAG: hypothetical protein P4L22_02495 [Candidatus Babeliales bacterium]|nr:hypothetical protein [Candidatus Babeliales bacterium]